jgi:endonuclease/exonuclease/phosphatase family metal-dependent hydrolase
MTRSMRTVGLLGLLLVGCASTAVDDDTTARSDDRGATGTNESVAMPGGSSSTPAPATPAPSAPAADPAKPADVTFRVLTYNVAGLPEGISKSHPATNTPQISPKLNAFDLVVVQEDFAYHSELVSATTLANQSTPMKGSGTDLGDGLNTLSRFSFSAFTRTKWTACNGFIDSGSDCMTPKGFTRTVVDLGSGRQVDFYDVHFDAGRDDGDYAARSKQVDQIVSTIATQSKGRAVIVAGDTNMKASDEPVFLKLLKDAGLSCACRTLSCPETARIDRVLFRSSASVGLVPQKYAVESWSDSAGQPLSDHDPVSVEFLAKTL